MFRVLEEQEPEEGLKKFVEDMWEANHREVFAPMKAWNSMRYTNGNLRIPDGKTVTALSIPDTIHGKTSFNGVMPVCKGSQNNYYLSVNSTGEITLWRIEPDTDK